MISDDALTHQNLGWLLIGATFTTFIAILTGSFAVPSGSITTKEIIAWAVVAVTLICGLLSLYFAYLRRGDTKMKSSDVLKQMQIIESRYLAQSTS
jgi:magnesium-transporting ATPase (P-type)